MPETQENKFTFHFFPENDINLVNSCAMVFQLIRILQWKSKQRIALFKYEENIFFKGSVSELFLLKSEP
jgi:hypothetical protein